MAPETHHEDIIYPSAFGFVLAHLACFAAIWTGITWQAVVLGFALYFIRMFAITAGFHRYFSHKSYKTSRVFAFIIGFVGQMTAQSGILWWAATHRGHHVHSDTEDDAHSPAQHGFFFAHVGWVFHKRSQNPDYARIKDLTRYPELVWLDKQKVLPAILLGFIAFLIAGWPGLVVGFFWSTVAVYHATFAINSLAHTVGTKKYLTADDSRNNWWLAILTLGEGWHNNHHYYQASARQGFRWWEIDISYYILRGMEKIGLVWDLRQPPESVVNGERQFPQPVIERAARRLLEIDHSALHLPSLEELASARRYAMEVLRTRALAIFGDIHGLDRVVERAWEILREKALEAGLIPDATPEPSPA